MNTIKFENKTGIKMIAHRGVSGLELENTCPAFVAAGVKSYYGIETDVHVTRDGRYIIHHDDSVARLTGVDRMIRDMDFDTLRALRMTDPDGETRRADLFLPTLDEYLSICKKYDKVAVLELKEVMSEKDVIGIATAVKNAGMYEKTTFISFAMQNLVYLRKAFPDASAQFLSGKLSEESIEQMLRYHLDADIYHKEIDRAFVDRMHKSGRVVNAWTVDTLEDADRLAACGIDMITSNILE